ncbi:MAG TPA: lysozyme inhibitor LprI family protein [Caulobacteraceae bacterium]|nr:lysozyme inhibitor LprI family protein [Caulobacteraceae bacterium]
MGYLIALGLLVAFSAALLSPSGRRVLAVMAGIAILGALGLYTLVKRSEVSENQGAVAIASGGNTLTDAQLWGNSAPAAPADNTSTNAAPVAAPSFDCTKAQSDTAKAICADPELASLDREMAEAYRARLVLDPTTQARQKAWIGARDIGCQADKDCLKAFTTARKDALADRGGPAPWATATAMPTNPGYCLNTSVAANTLRYAGYPAYGSIVSYTSGGQQVATNGASSLNSLQPGESVIVCLVTLPEGCAPNDSRGTIYAGAAVGSGSAWREPNSDKVCGAA